MSLPKNVVSVDLGNLPRPVALDLLDASAGASVVAYADPSGHTRLTLPYSATDDSVVKFYVDADEVWLSAKVNGHEVADAGGTTKHVVTDTHRSDAAPAVRLEWNADRLNQAAPSGGSSAPAGVAFVTAVPFAFDSPGLSDGTGLDVYTPTAGEILLDAWVEFDTAFDGNTPRFDMGISGDNWFNAINNTLDATLADETGYVVGEGIYSGNHAAKLNAGGPSSLSLLAMQYAGSAAALADMFRILPWRFTDTTPVQAWVTGSGSRGGGGPSSTQGAGVIYLLTAKPAGNS